MLLMQVAQRPAVAHHEAVKLPLSAQDVDQQPLARAAGFTIGAIVSAHDRVGAGLRDAGFKRRQVGFPQILGRHLSVETVALPLWSAVYGEMFGGGDHFEIDWVVTL